MENKKQQYVSEYGVKRYNHGFFKFGPMEQCTDGEWARWKDVEPFLHAAELRVLTSMEYEKNVQDHLEAYKRRIEEQASAYECRVNLSRADRFQERKALLLVCAVLVFITGVCIATGGFHA